MTEISFTYRFSQTYILDTCTVNNTSYSLKILVMHYKSIPRKCKEGCVPLGDLSFLREREKEHLSMHTDLCVCACCHYITMTDQSWTECVTPGSEAMVPGLSESFFSRWRVRLALRNCDSIGVIFYILKLENNSKTVLGGEKKLEVWKLKLAASKIWQCWKAHSPSPDFVFFLASTLLLIDWFIFW